MPTQPKATCISWFKRKSAGKNGLRERNRDVVEVVEGKLKKKYQQCLQPMHGAAFIGRCLEYGGSSLRDNVDALSLQNDLNTQISARAAHLFFSSLDSYSFPSIIMNKVPYIRAL